MAKSSRVREASANEQEEVEESRPEEIGASSGSDSTGSLRLLSLLWQARAELALADIEKLATELESEIESFPQDDIEVFRQTGRLKGRRFRKAQFGANRGGRAFRPCLEASIKRHAPPAARIALHD